MRVKLLGKLWITALKEVTKGTPRAMVTHRVRHLYKIYDLHNRANRPSLN